jgi:hypothetical protein
MAAPRKKAESKEPRVKIETTEDGTLRASWPVFAYRVLFANGDTLTIESPRDDSDVRGAVLEHRKLEGDQIMGVARLGCVGWT